SSILVFSSSSSLNLPYAQNETNNISAEEYDKIKNCSKDLGKKPSRLHVMYIVLVNDKIGHEYRVRIRPAPMNKQILSHGD
ncbi:MAG TPA: hypothetical protein VH415_06500, partial [Nitrososphaeraceae archaeon]